MPEWAAATPWWVALGLLIAFVTAVWQFARWTGRVDTKLDDLGKAVAEIREAITKLLQGQSSKTVSSGSPLQLTDLGKRISADLGIPSIAASLAHELRERVSGKPAYDIQELSFAFIRDEYRPGAEMDARIKQCAYENGIDRDGVLDVLAIELRDRLMAPASPRAEAGA